MFAFNMAQQTAMLVHFSHCKRILGKLSTEFMIQVSYKCFVIHLRYWVQSFFDWIILVVSQSYFSLLRFMFIWLTYAEGRSLNIPWIFLLPFCEFVPNFLRWNTIVRRVLTSTTIRLFSVTKNLWRNFHKFSVSLNLRHFIFYKIHCLCYFMECSDV